MPGTTHRSPDHDSFLVSAAYGVRIRSANPVGSLAVIGASHWPELELLFETSPAPSPGEYSVQGSNGRICLSRDGTRVRFPSPPPSSGPPDPDEVVHPMLSLACWMRARALGDEVLHAGAFAGEGGAWLVVGDREAGKSTLLAQLHLLGVPIVTDDLSVLRGGRVFAGPRCIDLRPDMATRLGTGSLVRSGTRFREQLPPIEAEHRVAGFIELGSSESDGLERVRGSARLARLLAVTEERSRRPPADLLDLACLPYCRLNRRLDPAAPGDATELLQMLPMLSVAGVSGAGSRR